MTDGRTFHQHLIEQLLALVRAGNFAPGSQFLTEREIAEKFKTSRPTANKALSSLVSAGVLEMRRGAGTFVRESLLEYDLERLVSFTDKARAAGKKPSTELLAYRSIVASKVPLEIAKNLKVKGEESLIYMERVRLADGTPVIYERRYVVIRLCPKMTRTDAKGSLYGCWTEKCGLTISGADEIIHAVNASQAEATYLKIPLGAACFRITAAGHANDNAPLWQEETYYRADIYEFRNRISGISGTHAAVGKIMP